MDKNTYRMATTEWKKEKRKAQKTLGRFVCTSHGTAMDAERTRETDLERTGGGLRPRATSTIKNILYYLTYVHYNICYTTFINTLTNNHK